MTRADGQARHGGRGARRRADGDVRGTQLVEQARGLEVWCRSQGGAEMLRLRPLCS